MATTMPPYSNKAPVYVIPTAILGFLALCIVFVRIYTRARRSILHADDWLIIMAEPLSLANICVSAVMIANGWGKPTAYLSRPQVILILKLAFAQQTIWIFTLFFVRISVATSLLRFGTNRSWRWPLYVLMGLQCCLSAAWVVIQFARCDRVASSWNMKPGAKCWPADPITYFGWACGSMYIVMDLVLSLMPIRLVRSLSRPTRDKVLIGVLMSLGLVATIIAGVKMSTFGTYDNGDVLQATVKPSMYAKAEELVGIIACSAPCLRSPIDRVLKKIQLRRKREEQRSKPSYVISAQEMIEQETNQHDPSLITFGRDTSFGVGSTATSHSTVSTVPCAQTQDSQDGHAV
ncbi:hypothetical protein CC80DRAFT_526283 [Byssothecium circinans]|uniref:Rhodopsin domain-containing protein n=1 Tax=Byssothecium circinans TaxID=147558 RepID=A0A6A5TRJ2_9PLEO|nr:hypothetical protein CC80DRAFT_526283 [Byssothecium circinans]